ncbi:MAG: NUDIX hydrolase [Hyphomicrobiaceae bacterium]
MANKSDHERPILTIDVVLMTLGPDGLLVGVQEREAEPFARDMALIGGYVHVDEDADTLATARRVLKQKAGLTGLFCEQLMTFSGPDRDPRGWAATVAYYALAPIGLLEASGREGIVLRPAEKPGRLAFDHNRIVATALARLRTKGAYSTLPAFLLPETFTLSELRGVYERVMDVTLNDSAFRRKMDELRILEPVVGERSRVSARPAQLYRLRREALQEFDRRI